MYEGRLENEDKLYAKAESLLKDMPDYVSDWYLTLRASDRTGATCWQYIAKIEKFLKYINDDIKGIKLKDITATDVKKYFISCKTKEVEYKDENGNKQIKKEETSFSFRCMVWSVLNNFFEYFTEEGVYDRNYMKQISRPSASKDKQRVDDHRILLTEDDFKKILEATYLNHNFTEGQRDFTMLTLFMYTGLRKTAVSSIMISDVDLENHKLGVVDKGNKLQTYYLNDDLCENLRDWLKARKAYAKDDKEQHLFLSRDGNGLSPVTITKIVQKYTKKALGRPLSPHKLRAGYCSILYKKTGDIEFVRRAVGHASSATTERYVVTKNEEREEAANIMGNLLA